MGAFAFGIGQFKAGFFDAEGVLREMDRVERRTLSRFGAFARVRMKSSLKYATGKSKPGQPPHVHKTRGGFTRQKKDKAGNVSRQPVSPLRELIFFAYDAATHSVVVGPAKFGGKGGIVPGLLEHGGPGVFKDPETGQRKRGVWARRAFVAPAAEAEVTAGRFMQG